MLNKSLEQYDPEINSIILDEQKRQKESIELIASENFASVSVLQVNGSILTNKYSEGKIGCRYYGGNENIDKLEKLCIERALKLFRLDPEIWGVNVQTLSGSAANMAVYIGVVGKDQKIMGLDLSSGGHLSHGYQTPTRKISASSLFFESHSYKCNDEGLIDYDQLEKEVEKVNPKLLIIGGSAYPREFNYKRLREIAGSRLLMMDMAHISGFIATQVMDNPFEYCDIVTTTTHKILRGPRSGMIFYKHKHQGVEIGKLIESAVFPGLQGGPHNQKIGALAVALKQAGEEEYCEYTKQVIKNAKILAEELKKYGFKILTDGTDCHIVMICLKGDCGNEVQRICELANISVNKNCIVGDKSPLRPSGLRLGTPAMTTRGLKEMDFVEVAKFIKEAIEITTRLSNQCILENGKIDKQMFEKLANESEIIIDLKNRVIKFALQFDLPYFNFQLNNN